MKKIIVWIVIVAVAAGGFWWYRKQTPASVPPQTQSGPMPLPVAHCQIQEVVNYNQSTGNLAAVESVDVRARVQGYLRTIAFKDGALVSKGDLLFEIEPETYQAERDRAAANLKSAASASLRAQQDYERVLNAVESNANAVSKQDVSKYMAERDMAEASVMAAKAALQQAELNLSYTRIYSPIDGKISRRYVDVGNLVGATDKTLLANIVRLDPLYVYFYVSELEYLNYQKNVREKMADEPDKLPVMIRLANEEEYGYQGRLDYMDNHIDPATGTLQIRGQIPNPDALLYPGMFVNIQVPVKTIPNAVLIPDKAIMTDLGGKYVLTVNDQNVLERCNIKLGQERGLLRVVTDGLTGDETFIVGGFAMARAGMPITPIRADGAPQAAPGADSSQTQTSDEPVPAQETP